MTHQAIPARTTARPKPPRKIRKGGLLLLAAVLIIVIFAVISLINAVKGTTWKATVAGYTVVNPADLSVAFHVTNTGSKTEKPTCTVNAQDGSGAYSGFNGGTLSSPVAPGQTETAVIQVTITHQGARYVTQASVSCQG